ncbi:CDP-glycerol glycerophosphotransferase family protein [Aciduricibacillus chroicocephali]|uniref:CDP-glycerol glycerophosphotransferase family protein n=1 Tax=Aciduricibacillus chroicocephali TaxID=3054939 RepID=A0ABY9KV81_9BACI|nr:CDP-glycerol glycerophosphotransferase family protein [Bacillaceae bacterium 44XB]
MSSKRRLREYISLRQKDDRISMSIRLANRDYTIRQLVFLSRNEEQHTYTIDATGKQDDEYQFSFRLSDHPGLYETEEDVYNLFILVRVPKDMINEEKLENNADRYKLGTDESGMEYAEYLIRLGRFEETNTSKLPLVEIDGKSCAFFKTLKGNISYSVNNELKSNTKTQINKMKMKKGILRLETKIFTKNSWIESCRIVFKSRESGEEFGTPIGYTHIIEETVRKFGLNRYIIKGDINLNELLAPYLQESGIFDIYFEMTYHDIQEPVIVRVGKPRFRARFRIQPSSLSKGSDTYTVSPYYTFKQKNLSLELEKFTTENYRYMKKMMKRYKIIRPFQLKKDIWLIGERPYKAQDTGYNFFKYMRENHPEKNVYYVIDEESPERKNVEKYGNILFHKSKEHIYHTLMANRIVGSHHPDYLYPLRSEQFKKKVKAPKVFLQHGVLGTKNMTNLYGAESASFETDLFLVSSDREKRMVVNDFGYKPNEVKVTGLSRFDSLFADDVPQKRQLLIIPTWRDWLVNEEQFVESEYFERYRNLVNSSVLHKLAQQYDFEIVFCLHPNMQNFTPFFEDAPVRVISQGEVDVQVLLKESAMMITDYSSVAFDFSFLGKPVIYYQFDRGRFIGRKGSHLDLDADLPGEILYTEEEVLDQLTEYAADNFRMLPEYEERASRFLKYKDEKSSDRIYAAVKSAARRTLTERMIQRNEFVRMFINRFRRGRFYFPMMKRYYRFAKKFIKPDEQLILFESGLGKQYSDSPRYIYEEIVKRGLPYKKVWVYNKKVRRFADDDTIFIKRLSPAYYYYLAKAKYWVNNQNFPTYITKRPETTYLQTWHGTPLKKMLYDLENVHGRTEGYVDRVGAAVKNWDYLISPSEYASKAFRSAFRYEGEMLEVGYPRNDIFYRKDKDEIAKIVKRNLDIPEDKKVILYAPTFRDDQTGKKNRFSFELAMDLEKMQEELGDEYVLLLRMHVVVSSKVIIEEEQREFVKNVSSYPDIQELMLAADLMITDYSSVMFDFANTDKPLLFFTYDLENYRDHLRGFYIDFEEEAPGPLLNDTDELIAAIEHIDETKQQYASKYEQFQKKFCQLEDGAAASRVVDRIFE